jgi:Putative zinc-finger
MDGAYVLGALSAEDRRLFENHLPACPECTRAVDELRGLPHLLAQLDPAELDDRPPAASGPAPVPASLLPSLVREVRRIQRRRTLVTAGSVAAAVAALGALAISQTVDRPSAVAISSPTAASPTLGSPSVSPSLAVRSLQPIEGQVVPADMAAGVAMTSVAWGTRLDLTCSYGRPASPTAGGPPDPEYPDGGADYALVVRTREGAVQQVATWHALPGRTMRLVGATAARVDDIVAIEVRSEHGDPLLRMSS